MGAVATPNSDLSSSYDTKRMLFCGTTLRVFADHPLKNPFIPSFLQMVANASPIPLYVFPFICMRRLMVSSG